MNTITAVILARNEEENIAACIESVSWCNEIIVINDNSSDKTGEIIKKKGVKIVNHTLGGDFAGQRNLGLHHARSTWVLFVDADERVTKELAEEIQEKVMDTQAHGFFIRRIDFIWGKKLLHGETGHILLLRLAKKDGGKWYGKVHEEWKTSGEKDILKNELHHFPHVNISEFLKKINFYTTLRAQELFKDGVTTNYFFIIAYPKAKFIQNYFIKQGFLDGTAGFVHAMIMSFHSFLVRSKLWLLWNKK